MDYVENGNIRNSVNYPNCDFGPVSGPRIAIFNKNVPNMISQFTAVLAGEGINIVDLGNKSRGDVAYTLINTDQDVTEETVARLEQIDGVFRVRVIRPQ